ncbi:nitroreductase family protein [Mycolicibacterium brisbanense]|uniref:Nitroreductase n=1 Tax=Mycolicibacterium brisbanense TaxID=146020 RepID=A0A100W2S3_9MYCO|nr:nitroreductase family protein [Mycolicibacterium brisbanense]MCV7158383.1 nitroreductase family protein [Mycolicibacterium brisbanense]GAS90568.1 nitroreductase [Mycolicibacterium brisbanense]
MEIYDVMRTTGATRQFTGEPLPDEVLERILDNARFAPSGGNRQGTRVVVIRDRHTREALSDLSVTGARRYIAQQRNGENPWNPLHSPGVSDEEIAAVEVPPATQLLEASVVLVVCVDLGVVAALDQNLDRIGVVSGASVYPFVWNILLAARNEGFGGVLTTMAVPEEPRVKALLGIPEEFAVAAVVPMGKPVRQFTKLTRRPVAEIATRERFDGEPF